LDEVNLDTWDWIWIRQVCETKSRFCVKCMLAEYVQGRWLECFWLNKVIDVMVGVCKCQWWYEESDMRNGKWLR